MNVELTKSDMRSFVNFDYCFHCVIYDLIYLHFILLFSISYLVALLTHSFICWLFIGDTDCFIRLKLQYFTSSDDQWKCCWDRNSARELGWSLYISSVWI